MKLIILAFIFSVTIHILFFSSYDKFKDEQETTSDTSKSIEKTTKSKVRYVRLEKKVKQIQKTPKKEEPKKEIVKKPKKIEKKKVIKVPKTFKKVEKKKITPQKKKPAVKKAKRVISKPIKKVEPKLKPKIIKPQEKRKTVQNKSLENFLLTDPVPLDRNMLDDITKSYLNLYGDEYNSFTKVQKVFLQKKLRSIVEITRSYFRFPQIAMIKRLNDYNVVEFMLYPNGDMKNLRIVQKGEYAVYDKAILETIEIAYKDFPRPKEITKVMFYITYDVY